MLVLSKRGLPYLESISASNSLAKVTENSIRPLNQKPLNMVLLVAGVCKNDTR